jgi:hypothetical protein
MAGEPQINPLILILYGVSFFDYLIVDTISKCFGQFTLVLFMLISFNRN